MVRKHRILGGTLVCCTVDLSQAFFARLAAVIPPAFQPFWRPNLIESMALLHFDNVAESPQLGLLGIVIEQVDTEISKQQF